MLVRAWLERDQRPGEDILLPEGSGILVFGRSPKCTIVFDDSRVSARHCELAWDSGFWKLRDLGSDGGTRINGILVAHSRALFSGDRIEFGNSRLIFRTDVQSASGQLAVAISSDPDDPKNWMVWADELQELGDPLGERIVQSVNGTRLDHMPWLGPLWDSFVAGELDIEWKFGCVKRATIRTAAGRVPMDFESTVSLLVNLRIGQFIREVIIDLPRLKGLSAGQIPTEVLHAQKFLEGLPLLPCTLESLSFGYHIAPVHVASPKTDLPMWVEDGLVLRLPRLRGSTVYSRAAGLQLRVLHIASGAKVSGIEETRTLAGVTRFRREGRNHLLVESPPGIPFVAEGNPCYVAWSDGRAHLVTGRMRGDVRVNNRIDALYPLLPNDVVDFPGIAKFRVELVA